MSITKYIYLPIYVFIYFSLTISLYHSLFITVYVRYEQNKINYQVEYVDK